MKKISVFFFVLMAFQLILKSQSLDDDLLWAAYNNDEKKVMELLRFGANPNAKSTAGITPLMYAVDNGNLFLVRILVEAGAKINVNPLKVVPPLSVAVMNEDTAMVQLLLDLGANPDIIDSSSYLHKTPLVYAINTGNIAIFNLLLEYGANPLKAGFWEPYVFYIIDNKRDTAMLEALLDRGIDINLKNTNGNTLLMQSVENQDIVYVKLLLERKADCRAKNDFTNKTVLDLAIESQNIQIFDLLKKCYTDSLEYYHKEALLNDFSYAARQIRKQSQHKYLTPFFSDYYWNMGYWINFYDFMTDFNFGIHESRYNFDISFLLGTRIWSNKVLIPNGAYNYLQVKEFRTMLGVNVAKNIDILTSGNLRMGVYVGASWTYSFGQYSGLVMDIKNKVLFSANSGIYYRKNNYRFYVGYKYMDITGYTANYVTLGVQIYMKIQ